jgi:hypothetical protein
MIFIIVYEALSIYLSTALVDLCCYISYLRFRHVGQFFMESGDFYDVSIGKVLHFIRSVGLIKC